MPWVTYGPNSRYNTDTGEVQYDRGGQWQTIGPNMTFDPSGNVVATLGSGETLPPLQTDRSGYYVFPGQSNWGWAMPTSQQLQQINIAQQLAGQGGTGAAAPQATASPSAQSYYYGQTPQISEGTGGVSGGQQTSMAATQPEATKNFWTADQWQQFVSGSAAQQQQMAGQIGLSPSDLSTFQQMAQAGGPTQPEATKRFWTPQQWQQFATGSAAQQKQMAGQVGLSPSDLSTFQQMAQQAAPAAAPAQIGGPGQQQPETAALQQLAQIDPTSEALRGVLGSSYLSQLLNTPQAPQFGGFTNQLNLPTPIDLSRGAAAPSQADVQSYLDLYKQIDPQGYAQRQAMQQQVSDYVTKVTGQAPTSAQDALSKYSQLDPQGYAQLGQLQGAFGSYLDTAQQQAALGSQLDPQTMRELEQSTRQAQSARGNIAGTPQMVAEAMTRGQAGMAIQAQREAALGQASQAMQGYMQSGMMPGQFGQNLYQQGLANQQGALGLQQSYLQSGQSLGDIANTLYGQGYNRYLQGYGQQASTALNAYQAQNNAQLSAYQQQLNAFQAQQQARQYAMGNALSYLGSGQTPYQAGASYLNQAQQNAASAAQGGAYQYSPTGLGQTYTGAGTSQFPQYGLDISQLGSQWYNSLAMQNPMYQQKTGGNLMGAGAGALGGAASGAIAGSAVPVWGTAVGAIGGALAGGLSGYSR
jgi:hypothetical protein